MKYSLNINLCDKTIFYTEYLLKKLIKINGHELVNNADADFILVSLCDITEIRLLKKIREQYPTKKIVVGGHLAVFFKLLAIFADYVNVGQGFEFFQCQTEEEIRKLDCIYYLGKDACIIPSVLIQWEQCPIAQITKGRYYYWSAVGCKNKCSFCLTSWANKPQQNNIHRIKKAYNAIPKGKVLKLIENEGISTELPQHKEMVKDMLLVDFLQQDNIKTKQIRIGLEFATEENRRKNGKFFTNAQLIEAIKKARDENIVLICFCIGGIEQKKDWIELTENIPDYYKLSPKLVFKFTNMEYQMFTPIHKHRFDIDVDNYLDGSFGKEIFNNARVRMKNFKTLPIKYSAHALWRTALSHCINYNEFSMIWKLRNTKNIMPVYDNLFNSGIILNDYSDEIKFWYENPNISFRKKEKP